MGFWVCWVDVRAQREMALRSISVTGKKWSHVQLDGMKKARGPETKGKGGSGLP